MGGCSCLSRRRFRRDPTHALFADRSHSIPDNVVALLGRIRAWNYSAENARSAVKVSTEQVQPVVIRPAGDGSLGRLARVRQVGVRLSRLTCRAADGPAQPGNDPMRSSAFQASGRLGTFTNAEVSRYDSPLSNKGGDRENTQAGNRKNGSSSGIGIPGGASNGFGTGRRARLRTCG